MKPTRLMAARFGVISSPFYKRFHQLPICVGVGYGPVAVKTDKRSGIVNDPNRPDQPQYIIDLIARVITVSLKTVEGVDGLPGL